jgi:hypothetical protein
MQRLCFAALALAACGTTEEDPDNRRPATVEYVTEAILAPSCGNAQCHSSFRNEYNYTFDTVAAAKKSLAPIVVPGDPDGSFLVNVMTRTIKRMPYDQPLPAADLAYIKRWISEGAVGLQ